MSTPTPLHHATVALIHSGANTLEIVRELQHKFDILGNEAERKLELNIIRLRREIAEFRAVAPEMAEIGFRQGHTWKEVVTTLESPDLLTGFEIVTYCVQARDKVQEESNVG